MMSCQHFCLPLPLLVCLTVCYTYPILASDHQLLRWQLSMPSIAMTANDELPSLLLTTASTCCCFTLQTVCYTHPIPAHPFWSCHHFCLPLPLIAAASHIRPSVTHIQGWPYPHIWTEYDPMFGDFPAENHITRKGDTEQCAFLLTTASTCCCFTHLPSVHTMHTCYVYVTSLLCLCYMFMLHVYVTSLSCLC